MAITIQMNYGLGESPGGREGQLAEGNKGARASATLEPNSPPCRFGRAVFGGLYPGQCSIDPASGKFLGIAISDEGIGGGFYGFQAQADAYLGGQTVSICTGGPIWVIAGSDTTAGAPAYVSPSGTITAVAAGGTAIRGSFRNATFSGGGVILDLATR